MLFAIVFCLFITGGSVGAVEANRASEGYPAGYLSNCPGSEKPARIPRKLLNQLKFVVEGRTPSGIYRKYYPYDKAVKGIASDPHVDLVSKRTVLFVTGWLDAAALPIPRIIGGAYLKQDYNVILLDYNRFTTYVYPIAARLARDVGKRTAMVFAELMSHGLDPKRTELIGLSLGGQVISLAAKHFRQLTGANFTLLVGLDPAGPCFRNLSPAERIDASDADRVEIVHTNMDGYGIATPAGHVDFYVNGGEFQPNDIEQIPCTSLCSHLRSYFLWLVALQHPSSFIGVRCDTVQEARDGACYDKRPQVTNVMGLETDFSKQGIYYLTTTNQYPYHIGKSGLSGKNEFWKSHALAQNSGDVHY